MISLREKQNKAFDALKDKINIKNKMQAPKVEKVIISSGTGSFKDKKKNDIVIDRLAQITGQKPAARLAKQSVASFKIRQGDLVGFQVTLRGPRMFDFIDRLVNIALPRTKDFRGLSRNSVDAMGNYTIGIKEHTIFAETADEDLKDVFGMSITIVTNTREKNTTLALLEYIGLPFKKTDDAKKSKK